MATTYATVAELRVRINNEPADAQTPDTFLQTLLDAAAWEVDAQTRQPEERYATDGSRLEAFSESEAQTRTFYEDASGIIPIDDLVSVTSVTRGTVLLDPIYYTLEPLNGRPKTRLVLHQDAPGRPGPLYRGGLEPYSDFYGGRLYPPPVSGTANVGQVLVLATWGFCPAAARPAVVKDVTLILAERAYERTGRTPLDPGLLSSLIASAYLGLDSAIQRRLRLLERAGQLPFA